MPYESRELGAAGHVLRDRLRFHQRKSSKSFTALSRSMKELGHPMSAARIGEAFNGYRRISTDELTALASALGVEAGRLILATSPASDSSLVDQIAEQEVDEVRLRLARAEFSIAPIEAELDRGLVLSKRERREAKVPEPEESLAKLERVRIEIELLASDLDRRGFRMDDDGER